MKKILITGVSGQVGHALQQALQGSYDLIALSRLQLDLTQEDEIRRVIIEKTPDIIINPAAYTAVDKAESEPELARIINSQAPKTIAESASEVNAALIHFSTDYVYDGQKPTAYIETDQVNPLSVYGRTKLAGEAAIRQIDLPHIILRTSWVYSYYGNNFLKTILRLATERDHLNVVGDQYGAPTSADSIAIAVKQLLEIWDVDNEHQAGVYHLTNKGRTSWYDFACQIVNNYQVLADQYQLSPLKLSNDDIATISTSDYPTPAIRPKNSQLDNGKLESAFGIKLPMWQAALIDVMKKLNLT